MGGSDSDISRPSRSLGIWIGESRDCTEVAGPCSRGLLACEQSSSTAAIGAVLDQADSKETEAIRLLDGPRGRHGWHDDVDPMGKGSVSKCLGEGASPVFELEFKSAQFNGCVGKRFVEYIGTAISLLDESCLDGIGQC